MARRRRVIYSPEFRAEAVRRVRNSDEPLKTICDDLGIAPVTLRNWVEASKPKPEVPLTDDERTELQRLLTKLGVHLQRMNDGPCPMNQIDPPNPMEDA